MRRIAVPTATRLPTKLPRPHINVPPITTRPSRHALRPERRDARTLKRPLYYGCHVNRQPAALDGFPSKPRGNLRQQSGQEQKSIRLTATETERLGKSVHDQVTPAKLPFMKSFDP